MFWPISWFLGNVIWAYQLCILAYVVTTWLGLDSKNLFVRLVRAPAEPLLRLIRPYARKIPGPLDWSPAIALLGLELLKKLVG
ncbi:MAG: YggT family protein [Polyangiaceae bacterium]